MCATMLCLYSTGDWTQYIYNTPTRQPFYQLSYIFSQEAFLNHPQKNFKKQSRPVSTGPSCNPCQGTAQTVTLEDGLWLRVHTLSISKLAEETFEFAKQSMTWKLVMTLYEYLAVLDFIGSSN